MQFTAICTDKTLVLMFYIQMNMPMLRNQPASRFAPFSLVARAAWACLFEFKILRLGFHQCKLLHAEQTACINAHKRLSHIRLNVLQAHEPFGPIKKSQ